MANEKDSVQILEAIQGLSSRMDGFAEGQERLQDSVKSLEEGQRQLQGSVKSLEVGQQEIHEMIHEFSTHVDQRFDVVDRRFESLEGRVTNIESKVTTMESKVTTMESKMTSMDSKMVTKDYLDDKLADQGVRYGGLIRQTNEKVGMLADALVSEKSLSPKMAKVVMSAEPFGRK